MDAIMRYRHRKVRRPLAKQQNCPNIQACKTKEETSEGGTVNEGVIPFNAWNVKEIGSDGALKQLSKSELLFRLAGLNTFSDAESDGDHSEEWGEEQGRDREDANATVTKTDQQAEYSVQVCLPPPPMTLDGAQTHQQQLLQRQHQHRPQQHLQPLSPSQARYSNAALHYMSSSNVSYAAQPARERLPSVSSVPSELSDEDDFDVCGDSIELQEEQNAPELTQDQGLDAEPFSATTHVNQDQEQEPGALDLLEDLGASWCAPPCVLERKAAPAGLALAAPVHVKQTAGALDDKEADWAVLR